MNGLKTTPELAADKPHGVRLKYLGGCRCVPCRAANSRYQSGRLQAQKNGLWNGLIDASEARRHLRKLSAAGIGLRTVSDLSGIGRSTLQKIVQRKRLNIRKLNADRILAITTDAVGAATTIPAKETWQRINWLLSQGFTKTALAKRLGYQTRALQINKNRITARNAVKIERFYNTIRAGE
jgi:hypothetical protein